VTEGLRRTLAADDSISKWHDLISLLRKWSVPGLQDPQERARAEDLCHQARVLIGETAQRQEGFLAWETARQASAMSQISEAISTPLNQGELTSILSTAMGRLGIRSYYLMLHQAPPLPGQTYRLIAAGMDNQTLAIPQEDIHPTSNLVPKGYLPTNRRYSLAVVPLNFREDHLGLAIFEVQPQQEELCETLGRQISSAIMRTNLTAYSRELYEQALQARKVAEEADLLKSRFLSTVSHELRTPLSLIVGTLEIMLQEDEQGENHLPDLYRRDMSCLRTSAQHLSRLIADVLDLASSQAGELHLSCEPLDLATFLGEIVPLGEQLANEKRLAWRAEMPARLPYLWADRTRLRQVILNLISNAVKFTENGGIVLTVSTDGDEVTISVHDTGMGIQIADQSTIFDEFYRSERSIARGYGGMGLGLAVSRRLIELHGGKIGVRSSGEEESGSTFFFTLPILSWPDESLKPMENGDRGVLLLSVIEDSAGALRDHLEQRGFLVDVLRIDQDPQWQKTTLAASPGAVVLDFHPAAERGWEVMRLLKQNPQTRDIPVLFYSLSQSQSGAMIEMDYLIKPLGAEALSQALERFGLQPDASASGPVILVVDDDPGILDLDIRLVRSKLPNCQILQASNGCEALDRMGEVRPDLVLLDLMMPEMDGFTVLERMRERESTRSIPVIVLTAQVLTWQDMARLQQGVAAILAKGLFSAEEVLSQVEGALARSKRLGSEAQRIVRQAMAYIHEHYAESITREALARHLAISDRYLTRCFTQEMGIPPITYLNRYRIRLARGLLEKGEQSITQIAFEVGFTDSNYFSRVFREEVGVSPSSYLHGMDR
jgi:signal transduction histidine kinase/CheY-like chemotaxis protein